MSIRSAIDAILALELGATGQDTGNRFSLNGLTFRTEADGTRVISVSEFETTALRLSSGPFVIEVGRLALGELVAQVHVENGVSRLRSMEATGAELSGVKIQGPLVLSRSRSDSAAGPSAPGAWHLAALAAAEGRIQAEIIDAHLSFDADVTVPIRRGQIDFNEATVEHVGPNSRMGVSQRGIYVDAPNGRSFIFQFPVAPVAGVEFEQRRVLGAWVSNRGKLQLQAFVEGLLQQVWRGSGGGFTEQARQLFQRTSISGDVRLSDGRFTAPGLEAELVGRTEGRNAIRLHSKAVGRGVTAEMPSMSVRNASLSTGTVQLSTDELTGTLAFRVLLEDKQLRFAFDIVEIKLSGLRIQPNQL